MPTLLSPPARLPSPRGFGRTNGRNSPRRISGQDWYAPLNVALLMYFLLNGILNVPASIAKTAGNFTTAFFWIGVTVVVLRHKISIRWDLWTCRFAFAFLGYTIASAAWGTAALHLFAYPVITATLVFLYFNYLVSWTTTYEFNRLMLWACGLLLFFSIVAALLVPSIGIDPGILDPNNRGAWQGVFGQKNQLGIATALSAAFSLGQRSRNLSDRFWRVLVFLEAMVCAYGSKSREAWLAIALQLLTLATLFLLRKVRTSSRPPIVIVIVTVAVAMGSLIYVNLNAALALVGRSPTASGRTNIWRDSLVLIARRPWFGYGTYGFWKTPYSWPVVVREGWNVPSSHNNYIEILIYYGILGMILFTPLLLSGFIYMYRASLSRNLAEYQVHIYVLFGLASLSMAAPLIMYYPAIGMLAMLYSTASLETVDRPSVRPLRLGRLIAH